MARGKNDGTLLGSGQATINKGVQEQTKGPASEKGGKKSGGDTREKTLFTRGDPGQRKVVWKCWGAGLHPNNLPKDR